MDFSLSNVPKYYGISLCTMCSHVLGPNFQEKNFCYNFLIQLFIYLYLDTCFLYYKGILAFIFEPTTIRESLRNQYHETQEQTQGVSSTTCAQRNAHPHPSPRSLGQRVRTGTAQHGVRDVPTLGRTAMPHTAPHRVFGIWCAHHTHSPS